MPEGDRTLFTAPDDVQLVRQQLRQIESDIQENFPTKDFNPESVGWEKFIAEHPDYVRHDGMLAHLLAGDYAGVLRSTDLELAKIGGALIRAYLSDEEITNIGK